MPRFPVESPNVGRRHIPAPRPAESFPPLLIEPDMYVDEATGLVLISGRAHQFAVGPTEITLPFVMIEAAFHTMLGMRLARQGGGQTMAAPAPGTNAKM